MKSKSLKVINPEWRPDIILASLLPGSRTVPQHEYQRALWLWHRKPKRFFFRHTRRTVMILLPAIIVNALTFLWPDSSVRADLTLTPLISSSSIGLLVCSSKHTGGASGLQTIPKRHIDYSETHSNQILKT